jgi:hypothetical protein
MRILLRWACVECAPGLETGYLANDNGTLRYIEHIESLLSIPSFLRAREFLSVPQ